LKHGVIPVRLVAPAVHTVRCGNLTARRSAACGDARFLRARRHARPSSNRHPVCAIPQSLTKKLFCRLRVGSDDRSRRISVVIFGPARD
jgi:hypothetical protein